VIQETSHIYCPFLTVRETLEFASNFLLPETLSADEKAARVKEFLYLLRLDHVADSVIGDETTTKGISGGQRQRVLLGAEIMHLPALLFLDEPTTGLDSVSANELLSILRILANRHRTIVCTIHQPSESCFKMFDKVLLLAKGGKMAYFGDVNSVKEYFESSIYHFVLDNDRNIADYMLDIASGIATTTASSNGVEKKRVTLPEVCELYTSSSNYFALQENITLITTSLRDKFPNPTEQLKVKTTTKNTGVLKALMEEEDQFYPTSTNFQAKLLFRRLWMERRRNTTMFVAPFVK
jgi:ABC-type multidrug transport system ATPase subunit